MKLRANLSRTDVMRVSSELNSYISDANSLIFSYKAVSEKTAESLETMKIFMGIVTGLLFFMSFFQLVLSIEGNLKDNMW